MYHYYRWLDKSSGRANPEKVLVFAWLPCQYNHDKIFANVSHLPHATAAALLNASDLEQLKFCGKGFMDTSRIASGPANIWADVFYTNSENICKGIERIIKELSKLKKTVKVKNKNKIEKLLALANDKRARLMKYKVSKKEIQ